MTDLKLAFKTALAKADTNATAVAEQMGINRKTLYSAFYTGNPRFSTIQRLADHFGMSASEFIKLGE